MYFTSGVFPAILSSETNVLALQSETSS